MAEMMGSAVVQEVVSGAFSFMRANHEEMASQSHLMERLKLAHLVLKFALERTMRMPIIEVSLLQRRMMLKHAFEESRDLLYKQHTQRVNLEDEGAEKGVTLSPSLPNRIMHAVKPFFGAEKGSISESCVRRFELFAEKTDKFRRDIESGFSLALYRFSYRLITELLECKYLQYEMVSGSQTRRLSIFPCCLEDYGVLAHLVFELKDLETPMKCSSLVLMLRLSESTDIVGISTKWLQALEPHFKSEANVASGELCQIFTQVSVFRPEPALRERLFNFTTSASRYYLQEPLCCIDDVFQPSAKNILSSKLTEKLTEQVILMGFQCFISATEDNFESSTIETNRNTMKVWPILQVSIAFLPHILCETEDDKVCNFLVTSLGEYSGPVGGLDLSVMAKFVPSLAVHCFKLEPERTEIEMVQRSAHGLSMFSVSKPTTEMGRVPRKGDGSKTRRASKRKR